nr:thioredoxin domain-containing protein [uncultured Desulfobacter sp.]
MIRNRAVQFLSIAGLIVAMLSALEVHLPWLASLCGYLGDGCRNAEAYTMFTIPIAYFGIGFFTALIVTTFYRPAVAFWLIMAGMGYEFLLVKIMIDQHFFCVFCVLNLTVMLTLTGTALKRETVWQSVSASLITLVAFSTLIDYGSGADTVPPGKADLKIAAIVAGTPIYHTDLEAKIAGSLYGLEKQIFLLKREQLDARIQDRLLALEAETQGISTDQLMADIYAGSPGVTEKDVADYYRENQSSLSKIKEDPAILRNKVAAYLNSQMRLRTMQAYLMPLMEKYQVKDLYKPPVLPLANVEIHNNFSQGPENAAVTIVEFSDYLCPSCRNAHHITKKIREKYKGKIRWIFKDYPLQRHKGAKYLAMAARCAGEQGKFWEFQDLLFTAGKTDLTRKDVMAFAASLGLDLEKFAQSLDSQIFLGDVEQDLADVKKAGVNATPTIIINGKLHPGSPSYEEFSTIINKELYPLQTPG